MIMLQWKACRPNVEPSSGLLATLKQELVYRRQYQTRKEVRQDIFEYIQVWYNRKPTHATLGYMSPEEFEHQSHCKMTA